MSDFDSLTTIEPWKKNNKKSSDSDLNRALTLLGFGAWSSLEPSKFKLLDIALIQKPFFPCMLKIDKLLTDFLFNFRNRKRTKR